MFGHDSFVSRILPETDSFSVLLISFYVSLTAAIAVILCYVLYIDIPFWAVAAVISVAGATYDISFYKAIRRIAGTAIGSIVGLLLAIPLAIYGFLGVVVIFVIGGIFLYFSKRCQEQYFNLFIGLHINFIGAAGVIAPDWNYLLAEYRVMGTIVGGLCVCVMVNFFNFPRKAIPCFKELEHNAAILNTLRASISMFAAVIIWEVINVPGGVVNMIITVMVIASADNDDRQGVIKGLLRLYGCLMGLFCGISCLVISSYLAPLIFPFFVLLCTCFMYYSYQHKKFSYAGVQAGRALAIICFPSLVEGFDFYGACYRALGVFLGIIITEIVFFSEKGIRYVITPIKQ